VTREILPTIVPDGDNSLPNVLLRTGGTKSKSKSSMYMILDVLTAIYSNCKITGRFNIRSCLTNNDQATSRTRYQLPVIMLQSLLE